MQYSTVLPTEPVVGPNPSVNLTERPPTEDELAESIRDKLSTGTAHYIAAGLECMEAKKRLKGRFTVFVETKLGWNIDTIDRWMEIARAFPDSATWRSLPSGWTTLYLLTRLPKDTREGWIGDGTINPKLTHKAAEALVRRARGSNRIGNGGSAGDACDDHHDDGHDAGRGDDRDVGCDDEDHNDVFGHAEDYAEDHAEDRDDTVGHAELHGGEDHTRNDVGSGSELETQRKLARADELEGQARCWEFQRTGFENEIEELKAKLDETSVRHQRRLFRQVMDAMQKAETSDIPVKEKRSLHYGVIVDLVEFVRSATRDGLSLNRFDVYCRPEPRP